MSKEVTVAGAGIIGICCAIALQKRNYNVTLIDKGEPGQEASYGNAGVLCRDAIFPLSEPGIWKRIPSAITGSQNDLRIHRPHLLQLTPWCLDFLLQGKASIAEQRMSTLNRLLTSAVDWHKPLLKASGASALLMDKGWLRVFRHTKTFQDHVPRRELIQQRGIEAEVLSLDEVHDLEPALKPIFKHGHWVKDSPTISNPGELCRLYTAYFVSLGGVVKKDSIKSYEKKNNQWLIKGDNHIYKTDKLVLALGAWSRPFLKRYSQKRLVATERGYHFNFENTENNMINRAVVDADGDYVIAKMDQGLRITSGVELTLGETAPTPLQLNKLLPLARQAIDLGDPIEQKPWMGRRPATSDSLPVIGEDPDNKGLYHAYGHGHLGLTLGPLTGEIIAREIANEPSLFDTSSLSPNRK